MTLIADALQGAMDGKPWQNRAKAAGLTQKLLARLLGHAENTVSRQLRGHWDSGIPKHVRSTILAWELMTPEQREQWVRLADDDGGE